MEPVKSAMRTLALFELFSLRQEPLTIAQIVRQLAIPQASASMLAKSLHSLGYLAYDRSTRTYLPTVRVILLGSWIARNFSESQELSRRLSELQRRFGQGAFIGIQNGPSAQYILVQDPASPEQLQIDSGQLRPLTCSAVGRIILSLKPDKEVMAWVRRANAEAKEARHRVQELAFLDLIWQVRRQGYAETVGDFHPDRSAIAVAVPSPVGNVPLAVGIGGRRSEMKRLRSAVIGALLDFRREFGSAAGIPSHM